ncbi:MAG: prephenate dehydrogenase/arogenate dehydrogenase family protein, partial [Pirellulales bacterium]
EGTTNIREGVADADFVLVATRVSVIGDQLEEIDTCVRPGTPITDAGSTKQSIVDRWEQSRSSRKGRFVGSHPLAGSHQRGPQAADPSLFEDKLTVLTPVESTPRKDTESVSAFWQLIGAQVCHLSPSEHDRLLASASHAPHVIAAALATATPREAHRFTAGGWRDTTRIAAGDPDLWADILLDNAKAVTTQIENFSKVSDQIRHAIEEGDRPTLIKLLTLAKESRDALGS